jgi:hypothetical protein
MNDLNTLHHDNRVYKYAFRDFVAPSPQHMVYVTGEKTALDALDFTLSRGSCVNRVSNFDEDTDIYAPLLIAIEHALAVHRIQGYAPITRDDLVSIQHQPWFHILLDQYAKTYRLSDFAQLEDDTLLTGDRVSLILEALTIAQRLPKVQFGVVAVCAGALPHACFYPPSPAHSNVIVWLVVETRFGDSEFYAIGSSAIQEQHQEGQDNEVDGAGSEDEEAGSDDGSDDGQEQPLELNTTSRETAARVMAQQVPLPAGLTATDILTNHKDRLQYNNVLKVALLYSNQRIADECKAGHQKLQQASGVVKRINTGLNWIEREFEISPGAFRAIFDRERKANGIPVRSKGDAVADTIVAANDSKIQAAMTWIKTGGPRPQGN